jgi:hypothetical protein
MHFAPDKGVPRAVRPLDLGCSSAFFAFRHVILRAFSRVGFSRSSIGYPQAEKIKRKQQYKISQFRI